MPCNKQWLFWISISLFLILDKGDFFLLLKSVMGTGNPRLRFNELWRYTLYPWCFMYSPCTWCPCRFMSWRNPWRFVCKTFVTQFYQYNLPSTRSRVHHQVTYFYDAHYWERFCCPLSPWGKGEDIRRPWQTLKLPLDHCWVIALMLSITIIVADFDSSDLIEFIERLVWGP